MSFKKFTVKYDAKEGSTSQVVAAKDHEDEEPLDLMVEAFVDLLDRLEIDLEAANRVWINIVNTR